eukprot:CAMPEP_0203717224 /NCGR_PEP_ID=MMETSP0092-20131115/1784_1 /ASSEMBLY_ACC=CAM_ASM_001090 /TAXON_ID=426623 /ORGANISM="Chaetoceros affinis, Strain CCMP159" /LENGTH=278 /DNA_ID=CAMNT_0050596023 /DNA_START=99 /DNA_END=935 /DNA_ORIENTATION=-
MWRNTRSSARSSSSSSSSTSSAQSENNDSNIINNNKIFCFGDSLTAGTSPPSFQNYPYAIHLESKLNSITLDEEQKQQQQQQQQNKYMVRHFGLPGWTATQLSSTEGNLQSTLERIKTSTQTYPKLVIILAGTNDLAYCTNNKDCINIFNSIRSIHDICHERNIDTVALSIPTSAWQSSQNGSDAASFAKLINEKIERWAVERRSIVNAEKEEEEEEEEQQQQQQLKQPMVHFVPFPIVEYDPSSGFWAPDGLHFSPQGYLFIGDSLAPIVKNILDHE